MFSMGSVTLGKQTWNTRVGLKRPSFSDKWIFWLHEVDVYLGHTGFMPFLAWKCLCAVQSIPIPHQLRGFCPVGPRDLFVCLYNVHTHQ